MNNPFTDPIVNTMIDAANETIKYVDAEMKEQQEYKFQALMALSSIKCEKLDYHIDMLNHLFNTNKVEKMLAVAITKHNFKLVPHIRQKYRKMADDMMEHMEIGVEKEYLTEETYVKNANGLKQVIQWIDEGVSLLRKVGKLP